MTNAYGNMNMYPQQQQYGNENLYLQQRNSGAPVLGLATVGLVGGGTYGYLKNRYPVAKDGTVSDSFAKRAFENHVEKNYSKSQKTLHKQVKDFLKKADNINTVEDFKKFLNSNKELAESCAEGIGTEKESFINSMTSSDFAKTKKALKDKFNAVINYNVEHFKNFTKTCWDSEKKKFVKASAVSEKVFNVIKNTKSNNQFKQALKYGGIGAGIAGLLAAGYNMLVNRNSV